MISFVGSSFYQLSLNVSKMYFVLRGHVDYDYSENTPHIIVVIVILNISKHWCISVVLTRFLSLMGSVRYGNPNAIFLPFPFLKVTCEVHITF